MYSASKFTVVGVFLSFGLAGLQCTHAKQRKLWVCNPTKLMTCEWLLRYHEARGDKVLVFSDNVFALLHTAKALNRPFIYGQVTAVERVAILNKFKVCLEDTHGTARLLSVASLSL